ncbi:hypothetical protein [Brevundimonas sp.]|jgi:hypothetical protein|uniref:hypothetical protein n=1 Tax=Brevundimonas sp. TaxID=1871086 RepID=UPI0025BDDE87|nr:hypothetical protein [Brevundimonas sp.]
MWNVVRTLLFALAVAGFVGQSSAHATPFQVFEATGGMTEMDCAEMMVMADDSAGGAMSPCSEMTPDCIAKMGCTAVAAPMPRAPILERPFAARGVSFAAGDVVRDGSGPPPLKNPPKQ